MTSNIFKERITCRSCGGPFKTVLDLGNIYLNDFIDEGKQEVAAPLTLVKCEKCDLVQLKHTSNLDLLYRQYWYKSSLNKSMIIALQDIINNIEQRIDLKDGDTVIDIGCNDGTMLGQYTNKNLNKIGFDPALNLASLASAKCNTFYNTYFGDELVVTPKAKVITTIAMFYDLEDPHKFIELIKQNLCEDGIWVIQFTDLYSQFKINAFDTICHEHLEYYSFNVLNKILEHHDFEIFDIQTNDVNGGSMRTFVCHKDKYKITLNVKNHRNLETTYMQSEDQFKAFSNRVEKIKSITTNFINTEISNGKTFAVLGASTKGNTALQYFGLNNSHFKFAAEVNPDKFGKKTVATNIPIISEEEAFKQKIDYYFVLPWHFISGLIKIHENYLKSGGKFLTAMPEPLVYEFEKKEKL